uniref:Fatty acid binding protein 6, ileal (gastrotropin) n=1 Tax=Lepisosteus oculatus TaxID=7918 RepID=W5MT08_LEPOC
CLCTCPLPATSHLPRTRSTEVMAFTGKYEIESQENYDDFLKHIGIPDDIIEKGRNFKIVTEVEQNGNEFTWSQVYPTKTMSNRFVLDKECEMETMAGKKFKATVTMEGGKISVRFPNYHHTAEVSGDKLVEGGSFSGTCVLIASRVRP